MLKIFCCLLLAGTGLFAQSTDPAARLNPVLSKALVSSDAAGELEAAMVSLQTRERPVASGEVSKLASALGGAMTGREIRETQAMVLSKCITGLLQGGDASNFALAARLRDALAALRVGDQRTDLIVRRFVAVGGPNDYPVKGIPFLNERLK